MRVGVPKETRAGERRVAIVPETARGLVKATIQVMVEAGAGEPAFFSDAAYIDAGANLTDAPAAFAGDAVLKVQPPTSDEVGRLREESVLISFLQPAINADVIGALAKRKVSAFSLDLVPRISRAQSMDALSSQAGIAGYKAVLKAVTFCVASALTTSACADGWRKQIRMAPLLSAATSSRLGGCTLSTASAWLRTARASGTIVAPAF